MNEIEELRAEVEKINERNHRVEKDKAWELSRTRTGFIAGVTFFLTTVFMLVIGADRPLLNAAIGTILYILSTFSYDLLKQWWLRKQK